MTPVIALNHSAELGGAELGFCSMIRRFTNEIIPVVMEEGPLTRRLRDLGCDPVVWPEINGAVGGGLARGQYRPSQALGLYRAATVLRVRLEELICSTGSRTVLLNSSRSTLLAALAGLPDKTNKIVMVRDSPRPPYLSRQRSILARLAIFHGATEIIANSPWTAGQLDRTRSIRVIAPFVDEEFFNEPQALLEPPVKCRVLLLGRIAPWKGQMLGLSALSQIQHDRISHVTVAGAPWFGEEKYMAQLRAAARDMPDHRIRFLGHVDDVASLIDNHDVVVHTSLVPEPFGQVIVQAMSRGRLIIAADQGGPKDMITHRHDGLVYKMGDLGSLKESLMVAIASGDAIRSISSEAILSSRRFHPSISEMQLRQVFDDLTRRSYSDSRHTWPGTLPPLTSPQVSLDDVVGRNGVHRERSNRR